MISEKINSQVSAILFDWDSTLINEFGLLDGAMDSLAALAERNIPVAIVSNKDANDLQVQVKQYLTENEQAKERLGEDFLEKLFVVGAEPGQEIKPHPDPMRKALKQLGVPASKKVWMIGDEVLTDIKGAAATMCYPILIGEREKDNAKALTREDSADENLRGKNVGYVNNHEELQSRIDSAIYVPQNRAVAK